MNGLPIATCETQDRPARRRTLRVRQIDTFEALVAASEAEDICADWIVDRLTERESVWS